MLFSTFADEWYKNYEGKVSVVSYNIYKYTLKKLKKYFKGKTLKEIKANDVERMMSDVYNSNSKSYVSKMRGMLYQIMRKAYANEYISKNPVELADKFHVPRKLGDELGDFFAGKFMHKKEKIPKALYIKASEISKLVEMRGIEPLTS